MLSMESCLRQAMRSLRGPLTGMAYGGTAQNHTVPGSVSWPLPCWPPELLPTLCCTVWNLFVFWRWDHSLVCVCSPQSTKMCCNDMYMYILIHVFQTKFCEFLLPQLIHDILSLNNACYQEILSSQISKFFLQHCRLSPTKSQHGK